MALKDKKQLQNILTGVVVALALILLLVVILVKTGIFNSSEKTTAEETVIDTAVVIASETQENGEVTYYTVFSRYARPKISSNHVYPTKKTTATSSTVAYVEVTEVEYETDAEGNRVLDENGQPVTRVMKYTVPADSLAAAETTTKYVQRTEYRVVTDPVLHRPKKDKDGNVLTEVMTLDPPRTEKPDIWSESVEPGTVTQSGRFGVDIDLSGGVVRDDALAQSIVSAINSDREAAGLAPLSDSTKLKGMARARSKAVARPDMFGDYSVSGTVYEFKTSYGGKALYGDVSASAGGSIMSESFSSVGVGVVKYMDTYYTTVIFE